MPDKYEFPDYFNRQQFIALANLFCNKENHDKILKNLIQTRQSLKNSISQFPESREYFIEQYHTIDQLITIISPIESSDSIGYNKN